MAILEADILFKHSIKTGTAGNQSAQADVNLSLGKYISTTQLTSAVLANLFDTVSGDENTAEDVEYRCLFVHNAHATLTLISPVVWISADISGGAEFAVGVDPTAASLIGASSAQAVEVANENTAPAGVTFSAPTTKATGLSLGSIGPGECKAFWFRRSAANTGAVAVDGASFRVEGDTEA